jgi:hypothetical protein
VVRLGLIKPPRLCFTLVKSLVKNDDSQCKTAEAGFPFFLLNSALKSVPRSMVTAVATRRSIANRGVIPRTDTKKIDAPRIAKPG